VLRALEQLCGVTRPINVIPPVTAAVTEAVQVDKILEQKSEVVTHYHDCPANQRERFELSRGGCQIGCGKKPEAQFRIYGEGALRKSLQDQIDAACLSHHVYLVGRFKRKELPSILRAADAFVLPSLTEGFPLSIVEAMAYGLPIVATDVGGVPELIENGVTGLLCPPDDARSLAVAILTIINNPMLSLALVFLGCFLVGSSRVDLQACKLEYSIVSPK